MRLVLDIYIFKKKIINKQCRTIDIFPTILDLAKISKESTHELQGESLISFLENPNEEDRDVFVETGGLYGPWPSPDKHNVFCIKSNGKKLIYNETPKTWEFYDLKSDPEELNNIYDENLEIIHLYKKKLFYYLKNNEIKLNF